MFICLQDAGARLQRYVDLQQAAAAKRFTTGPAPGGSREEAEEDTDDGQGGDATAGPGKARLGEYSGAAGQRARREVLTELLERVARSGAQLLLPPLLDNGACSVLPPAPEPIMH